MVASTDIQLRLKNQDKLFEDQEPLFQDEREGGYFTFSYTFFYACWVSFLLQFLFCSSGLTVMVSSKYRMAGLHRMGTVSREEAEGREDAFVVRIR